MNYDKKLATKDVEVEEILGLWVVWVFVLTIDIFLHTFYLLI